MLICGFFFRHSSSRLIVSNGVLVYGSILQKRCTQLLNYFPTNGVNLFSIIVLLLSHQRPFPSILNCTSLSNLPNLSAEFARLLCYDVFLPSATLSQSGNIQHSQSHQLVADIFLQAFALRQGQQNKHLVN